MALFAPYFYLDTLSVIMLALVGFVCVIVFSFSTKYLAGDRLQKVFQMRLGLLLAALSTLALADHMLVFLGAWGLTNFLLVRLMAHKASWRAAQASGQMAAKNFGLGLVTLALAFAALYEHTGQTSIHEAVMGSVTPTWQVVVLALVVVTALTQSAIWPFHRWLLSSLNAPTLVSALMHAGIVNGGGFLLARFAPLFFQLPVSLNMLFVLGLITTLLGTLWKLMQSDIKRMLACSTMGQMGFMMVQCGLGLFPAAIAHLCWHGLFKAYLFLSSGSGAQEKRLDLGYPPSLKLLMVSLLCGVFGAAGFVLVTQKDMAAADTTLVLVGLAFLAGAQAAMPLLGTAPLRRLLAVGVVTFGLGGLYGFSVHGVEAALGGLNILQPQPLAALHVVGFGLLFTSWLAMLYKQPLAKAAQKKTWALRLYVQMLNASQPHATTVTAHRNQYQYR